MNLVAGFIASAARFPDRDALMVEGAAVSYRELADAARSLSSAIPSPAPRKQPFVGVLASRSLRAYAAVLGTLLAGRAYMPLNPAFPVERLARMLEASQCDVIIAAEEGLDLLSELLRVCTNSLTVIVPRGDQEWLTSSLRSVHSFVVVGSEGAAAPDSMSVPEQEGDSIAYLLFTSGSTGRPKGVAVTHRNVLTYVRTVCERYGVSEHDRLSQHFELSFDLSVHDMFVAWERGACVCSVPEAALMAPAKFIRDQELTMWFSVPSTIRYMARLGLLRPGIFPTLRWALFCGEPLTQQSAMSMREAAPRASLENLYGPTEATIAITAYPWDDDESPEACVNGIVPIGFVFPGQRACVVDADRRPAQQGEVGELALGGTQVTPGYWEAPDKTAERFVTLQDSDDSAWYLTGDLVQADEDGCYYYLGRLDDQVQIRGYRVELPEVDAVVRRAAGSDDVASVAWPVHEGNADGIHVFLASPLGDEEQTSSLSRRVLDACRRELPPYMVPHQVHTLECLPLNANGKVDRGQLRHLLEEGST